MPVLVADHLEKTYTSGEANVTALAGVSFAVEQGDFVALMGPSGCGKSTLLHLCGAMDRATSGTIVLNGRNLATLGDDDLTHVRREQVGFVFQFFNLLPTLTIRDNIALPCLLAGMKGDAADARAKALAERVGIGDRLSHFPQQVSGGEMQRAAIARALVHQPALLVADEPTGNLDSDNGARVLALLSELNREMRVTVLLATHSADVAAAATRVLRMRDGRFEPGNPATFAPGATADKKKRLPPPPGS
jgi:ABC-type lipoprotein export system ATPase subunit